MTIGLVFESTFRWARMTWGYLAHYGGALGKRASALDLLFFALIFALSCPEVSRSQDIELHRLSEGSSFSDVLTTRDDAGAAPQLSPDSRRAVYWLDRTTDDAYELYSARTDGSEPPIQLSGAMPVENANWDRLYRGHAISADGQWVVYVGRDDGSYDLFAVPIGGGARVQLNNNLPEDAFDFGQVVGFSIHPNSDQVFFIHGPSYRRELFVVPIQGGAATRLNKQVSRDYAVKRFQIHPSGNIVVYIADEDEPGKNELHSVDLVGGVSTRISENLSDWTTDVVEFSIADATGRVVYLADKKDEVFELFSAPIDGGSVIRLNGSLVAGGDVRDFQITPDGQRVVYRADQQTEGIEELYSVPIAGGADIKLSPALVYNALGVARDWALAPSGDLVIFRADRDVRREALLFAAPVAGGSALEIGAGIDTKAFAVGPASRRVVFRGQKTSGISELFSVPILGGSETRLNDALPSGAEVENFGIGNDGVVYYLADQNVLGPWELFRVSIEGGKVQQVNGPPVDGGSVREFGIGETAVTGYYLADQLVDNKVEIWSFTILPVPDLLFRDRFESVHLSSWHRFMDGRIFAGQSE